MLRFGDFGGDRKTDVFVSSGGVCYLSKGGAAKWTHLNTSYTDLQLGHLSGDAKTDVDRASGGG